MRFGFFSAHAANTFSLAVFFIWLVRSRLLSIALVLWSFVNCWTRLYLGVHYPGDIAVGLLWGGIVGTAMWFLYNRLMPQNMAPANYVSEKYTPTGFLHQHVDAIVVVLVATLLFAIFKATLALP